jgi:hypothetical protein
MNDMNQAIIIRFVSQVVQWVTESVLIITQPKCLRGNVRLL